MAAWALHLGHVLAFGDPLNRERAIRMWMNTRRTCQRCNNRLRAKPDAGPAGACEVPAFFRKLLNVFVCTCMSTHMSHGIHMEVRRQPAGGSRFSPL